MYDHSSDVKKCPHPGPINYTLDYDIKVRELETDKKASQCLKCHHRSCIKAI